MKLKNREEVIVISSGDAFKNASLLGLSTEFSNGISEQREKVAGDEEKYDKMSKDKRQYGFIDRFIFKSKRNYYKRKKNRLANIEDLVFKLDGISKDCFPFGNNDLASIRELLSLLPFDDARELRDTINNSLSSNKNSNKQRLQSRIRKIKRALETTEIAKKFYKSSFGLVTFGFGINKIEIKAKEVLKSPISISDLKHVLSTDDDNFFSDFSKNFMSGKFDFGKGNARESIENLVRARRLAVCYGSIVTNIDLVLGILGTTDKIMFASAISLLNRFRDKYSGRVVTLNNMLGLGTKDTVFKSMSSDQKNAYDSLVALASKFAELSLSSNGNFDFVVIKQQIEAFKKILSPDLYRAAISDGFSSAFDSYSKLGDDTSGIHFSVRN